MSDELEAGSAALEELLDWNGLSDVMREHFVNSRKEVLKPASRHQGSLTFLPPIGSESLLPPSYLVLQDVATHIDWALDLVTWCLAPHPDARPTSMEEVIAHKFFQGKSGRLSQKTSPYFFMSHAQASGGAQVGFKRSGSKS